jgi:hypothetical protein
MEGVKEGRMMKKEDIKEGKKLNEDKEGYEGNVEEGRKEGSKEGRNEAR